MKCTSIYLVYQNIMMTLLTSIHTAYKYAESYILGFIKIMAKHMIIIITILMIEVKSMFR